MAEPDSAPVLDLATVLRAYVEARAAAMLAARKTLDIGELDARALLFIVDHPGSRPGDLRSYLGITSAGVTTLTDRLVERGVVRRDHDEEDRRAVRLTSVVDLQAVPWSALNKFDVDFAAAIAGGDPDEAAAAARLIDKLTRGNGDG